MNNEIILQAERISLESETYGISQLVSSLSGLLQSYISNIQGFLDDMVKPDNNHMTFSFQSNNSLEREIKKTNYVSLSSISAYVPAGMSKDWNTFMSAVEASQSVIDGLIVDALKPATMYFSHLLANPETMTSIAPTGELSKIKLHPKEMEQAKKVVASCYSKHGVETKRLYGDVFHRNNDWFDVNKRLALVSERMAKVSPKAVNEAVEELTEILNRLLVRMRQSPEVYKVNGITSGAIARVSLQLGYEVEFYASHCYLVQTAIAALDDTSKHLVEVLKR